jgi:ankyrin repeat protein
MMRSSTMKRTETGEDPVFMRLLRAIVVDDAREVEKLVERSPTLPRQCVQTGATRQAPHEFFFDEIKHYLYAGDTALHAAAAGYRLNIARELIEHGAAVDAANRRGAQPLHYSADGGPGSPHWNPEAQAETIALLVSQGADPNAFDKTGVAPLHRAVRQRCLAAVDSLLRNGADIRLPNKSGSTALHLAVQNTGKSGSGSPEATALQKEIIVRLLKAGADPEERDGSGKTARQCAQSDWIEALL